MALIVNRKEYSILENNKPNLGGSGLLDGRCMTETNRDVSIVADRPIFDNRSSQMSKGFKVIPHSILESAAWQGATFKYRAFLIEILLRCVWKKTTFVSNGHVIELLPGQFACSLRNMANLFNPQGRRGLSSEDKYTKHDIVGAINYFFTLRLLVREVRHGITILTITEPDIYDSNFNFVRTDDRTKSGQQADSHLKEPVNQRTKETKDKEDIAQNDQDRPSIKVPSCQISFSFESGKFEGITEADLQDWKVAYPNVDVTKQLARMVEWIKSNPSKCKNRKLWRKLITGWLRDNDDKELRQAFASQKTFGAPQVDRRRRNPDGTIANDKEYLF